MDLGRNMSYGPFRSQSCIVRYVQIIMHYLFRAMVGSKASAATSDQAHWEAFGEAFLPTPAAPGPPGLPVSCRFEATRGISGSSLGAEGLSWSHLGSSKPAFLVSGGDA